MDFADQTSRQAWDDFIEADSYLRSHRGRFSERNALRTPAEHRIDLHISQDFYFGPRTSRRLQLTLDVINLGNMLNRNWGAVWSVANSRLTPVRITALNEAEGGVTPVYQFTGAQIAKNDILSRWHMQLGIRVTF